MSPRRLAPLGNWNNSHDCTASTNAVPAFQRIPQKNRLTRNLKHSSSGEKEEEEENEEEGGGGELKEREFKINRIWRSFSWKQVERLIMESRARFLIGARDQSSFQFNPIENDVHQRLWHATPWNQRRFSYEYSIQLLATELRINRRNLATPQQQQHQHHEHEHQHQH